MPKLAVYKFLTFYVFAFDLLDEPPHVHVVKEKGQRQRACKIWLHKIKVAKKGNFKANELQIVLNIVKQNQSILLQSFAKAKANKKFKTIHLTSK